MYNILVDLVDLWNQEELIKMWWNESSSEVHICKNVYNAFPIQNGLKEADALSPFLSNFTSE
jgi:hypothetical protein